jgi:HTH-type transcriptional regulator / antitoxin MqsA
MSKQECSLCGEFATTHKVKNVPYTYKGIKFFIDQPAVWCDACGEGVISAKDNKSVMEEIQSHKARIDGLLTPVEIKEVRKKLKLSQKEAGYLFGGGINAFNRYEGGLTPIPKPLSLLLILLKKHPRHLQEIKSK